MHALKFKIKHNGNLKIILTQSENNLERKQETKVAVNKEKNAIIREKYNEKNLI